MRVDWMIAQDIAKSGRFTVGQIAQELGEGSPNVESREVGHVNDYAQHTAVKAWVSSEVQAYREKQARKSERRLERGREQWISRYDPGLGAYLQSRRCGGAVRQGSAASSNGSVWRNRLVHRTESGRGSGNLGELMMFLRSAPEGQSGARGYDDRASDPRPATHSQTNRISAVLHWPGSSETLAEPSPPPQLLPRPYFPGWPGSPEDRRPPTIESRVRGTRSLRARSTA